MQLTSHSENILCGTESISFGDTDGKPDDTKEEIEHHKANWEAEDDGIHARWQIVDCNSDNEEHFRNDPNERAPFYIIIANASREIDFPDCELGNEIVCSGLEWVSSDGLQEIMQVRFTWQFPATNVIHAVQDHQATMNPKNLAYLGPALSAAQI